MTVETCLNTCANQKMTYASISNGNTCTCGSTANLSAVSTSYACNLRCAGDANAFCGAVNRFAIYNGGAPVSVPTTSVGPTSTATTAPPGNTGSGGVAQKYGQCGGIGWTGPTVCAAGSTCQVSNA